MLPLLRQFPRKILRKKPKKRHEYFCAIVTRLAIHKIAIHYVLVSESPI